MHDRSRLTVLVYPVASAESMHEFLLLRRIPSRGGFWQGVSGAVQPGEPLEEAAIRELSEETALVPIRLVAVRYHYTFPVKKGVTAKSRAT